jgi:hypothetical protein
MAGRKKAEPFPESGISGLVARTEGESILITYNVTGKPKNAVLYRSLHPVTRPEDLLKAEIVRFGVNSPFIDYPIPGISWYYAVMAEDEIAGGNVSIYPGRNATSRAAIIAAADMPRSAPKVRSMPLPAISVSNAIAGSDYFSEIREPVPLREETVKALSKVEEVSLAPPEKKPRVFTRDLDVPAGGEDSALMRIVQGPFIKRDWGAANEELQRYLSLPRSAAVESRARFYLGQTCYFIGKFREALLEFLFVRSMHPKEANVWIDAALSAMVR